MLRIVHLSDIHLDYSSLQDSDEFVTKALVKDLENFHDDTPIDIIVITGDLINKGGGSFDDISYGFLFFEEHVINPICSKLKLDKNHIFITPGNHDIKRDADEDFVDEGLKKKLVSIEAVNDYIDSNRTTGIMRILPYKEFENMFYENSGIEMELTNYNSTFKLELKGEKIGITCFNSAWRCYDSSKDFGNIIIGERQITNARKFLEDCNYKIGLFHHPLDWLASFEKNMVSTFIHKDYDAIFCGHVHEGSSWTTSTLHGNLFISVAPTNWSYDFRGDSRDHANGYSIIDIQKDLGKIVVNNRRYSYLKEEYVSNTDLGDEHGISIYSLLSAEQLLMQNFELDLTTKIREMYVDQTSEHLLCYNTNSNAPKNIQEMFIPPVIVDKPLEEKDKRKIISLDEICNSNKNYLILGSKESGKTVFLDRLLIEFTSINRQVGKIPIYIDFDEFRHSKIQTGIGRFLGIPIREVETLLTNHQCILLIDNLDYRKIKLLNTLDKFISENSNVQIIATSTYTLDGDVPLELLQHINIPKFKFGYLQEFNTNQIRLLMRKWFKGNKDFDNQEKLDKLLKLFLTLDLPRTPFAVSMFLWIFEQQGNNYKPINNATMLKQFIEGLLEKTSPEEVFSDTYDSTNKERLLSKIALEMLKRNNEYYSLPYYDLRAFIYENINRRKFKSVVKDEDILQEFINKGIFVVFENENKSMVKFRFNCFFKYFLSKSMDFDIDFREMVISEEYYLNFVDEIDYYTGLKRDQDLLLKELVQRMDKSFLEIIKQIESSKYSYDGFFETENSLTGKLDTKFVDEIQKPNEDSRDKLNDEVLCKIKQDYEVRNKDTKISDFDMLQRQWILTAKVLKNTEETEIENLKEDSLKSVLIASMACGVIYKQLLNTFIESYKDENSDYLKVLNSLFPIAIQSTNYNLMGTAKLLDVIEDKVISEIDNDKVTDLEKILTVFLYTDLKGKNSNKYLKQLVTNIKQNYSNDLILLKLLQYYKLETNSEYQNTFYQNLLAEIILDSKKSDKMSNRIPENILRERKKGQIIEELKNQKLRKVSSQD